MGPGISRRWKNTWTERVLALNVTTRRASVSPSPWLGHRPPPGPPAPRPHGQGHLFPRPGLIPLGALGCLEEGHAPQSALASGKACSQWSPESIFAAVFIQPFRHSSAKEIYRGDHGKLSEGQHKDRPNAEKVLRKKWHNIWVKWIMEIKKQRTNHKKDTWT